MRAVIAGRDVYVGWSHILTTAAILITYAFVVGLITVGAEYAWSGEVYGPLFTQFSSAVLQVSGVIIAPLMAWLFLRFAPKGERERGLCLSMAGAVFILESALRIVGDIVLLAILRDALSPQYVAVAIFGILSGVANAAFGSAMIYLWMLYFLKNDRKRLFPSAAYAIAAALAFYVLSYMAVFAMEYSAGTTYVPIVSFGDVIGFAGKLAAGFIVLYHIGGKKIVWDDAYAYSGLYLAGAFLGLLSAVVMPPASGPVGAAAALADRVLWLALLFVTATNWKDTL